MYWSGSGMSGWGIALMTLGNVALSALMIVAVVTLFRAVQRRSEPEGRSRPTPEQLLAVSPAARSTSRPTGAITRRCDTVSTPHWTADRPGLLTGVAQRDG
ncbi:hypothetical protein ABZ215_14425 [Amycolatopsis sp. NPDC006131]|uniref:hypothetical protein n=1 Tax=Amycolatopsis sp. NPDC006131 TaxID=3156731 RepID=UPI0033AFD996